MEEPILTTVRLTLVPLTVDVAAEMVDVLADPELYRHIGGAPPSYDDLVARYTRQVAGPGGDETWHNWIVRLGGRAVGYVQATVRRITSGVVADVAWVIGTTYAGQGFATEAAAAMIAQLRGQQADEIRAYIADANTASPAVARKLGLVETDVIAEDERRWVLPF